MATEEAILDGSATLAEMQAWVRSETRGTNGRVTEAALRLYAERAPRMLAALREAEAGLEFAVARLDAAGQDWKMSAERQALGIVRAAIAEAKGGTDGG